MDNVPGQLRGPCFTGRFILSASRQELGKSAAAGKLTIRNISKEKAVNRRDYVVCEVRRQSLGLLEKRQKILSMTLRIL